MKTISMGAAALGLLIAAMPVTAQQAPQTNAPPAASGAQDGQRGDTAYKRLRGHRAERMFPSMSEAGHATMREAMSGSGNGRDDRQQIKAARDRMLTLLDAERLDSAALKRAMDEERTLANASRERRQAAMLTAFAKLSAADRKAFVADSRAMKSRMEERMEGWRARRGESPPAI